MSSHILTSQCNNLESNYLFSPKEIVLCSHSLSRLHKLSKWFRTYPTIIPPTICEYCISRMRPPLSTCLAHHNQGGAGQGEAGHGGARQGEARELKSSTQS
jgi:hypothetical protein